TWSENVRLQGFPYNRSVNKFDLVNTMSSPVQGPTGYNGALLSVSSNGSIDSTAILWVSHAAIGNANQSTCPGILRALSAADISKELWNSSMTNFSNPGNYAKFNCPTIANGKVYLATFSNKLVVYGLTDYVDGLPSTPSNEPVVYPNSASEVVHVARGEDAIKKINLFDLNGKLVGTITPG